MQSKSSIRIFTVLYAILTSSLILSLFTYWFAFANRAIIFLYDHDMGALVPDTTPFSRVTNSRYWMAGLVADGFVLLLYTAVTWLLGRWRKGYRPPQWWKVWALSAVLIAPSILLITMTANEPTLPLGLAVLVTAVTLIGLIFALLPGDMAAQQPGSLLWLVADGLGITFVFYVSGSIGSIVDWINRGSIWIIVLFIIMVCFAIGWLTVVTAIRIRRQMPLPSATAVFLAGVTVAYLVLPLTHHLIGTDGFFYITNSDNFFARTWPWQLFTWLIGGTVAWGLTKSRRILRAKTVL